MSMSDIPKADRITLNTGKISGERSYLDRTESNKKSPCSIKLQGPI
jgi:hypothetical protein